MILDKQKKQSNVVTIDAVAVTPDKLRMDFTTPLGIYLGSFALNGKNVEYHLREQKKVTKVLASPKAMRPLIKTDLDPYLLVKLLFDQDPPVSEGWACKKDARAFLKKCDNKDKNLSLEWFKRVQEQRSIEITSAISKIQISLKGFQPKVETDASTFKVEVK